MIYIDESPTRQDWGYRLGELRDAIRLPDSVALTALLEGKGQVRWGFLLQVLQSIQLDWSTFTPLPLDPGREVKSFHLIHCTTDREATKLCSKLRESGKTLHPTCDGKAGYYSTHGEPVAKLAPKAQVPEGYKVLPAHMFL